MSNFEWTALEGKVLERRTIGETWRKETISPLIGRQPQVGWKALTANGS